MTFQQTVATELTISGQTLHSGVWVTMRVFPQPVNTGIYFGRSDLADLPRVKADVDGVIDTRKSVTVGKDGWKISTIEHLMAVFHSLGIDNALVLVDGEELPYGDGCGLCFAKNILQTGIVTQEEPRRYLHLREPVWVQGNVSKQEEPSQAWMIALPGDSFQVHFTFTSDHLATGTQYFQYALTRESFLKEIAPARTIAFMKEINYLQSQGLALGGDMNSVVIVDEDGYRNELRFPEEIVRHKILDLLGDLYLLGPLAANIFAIRSGHTLDLALAKKIAASSIAIE